MYAPDPLLAAVAPRIDKDHTTIHKDMGAALATGNDIIADGLPRLRSPGTCAYDPDAVFDAAAHGP